jgi:hypothetical protein
MVTNCTKQWVVAVNMVVKVPLSKGKDHPITGHQGPRGGVEV